MKNQIILILAPFLLGFWGASFSGWLSVEIPHYDTGIQTIEHLKIKDPKKLEIMNIANQIGGEPFVLMLDQENDKRQRNRQSDIIRKDGTREKSYGFCQLNLPTSKKYTRFYNSPYFKDPVKQLLYCYNEYMLAVKWWYINTKFYGYKNRNKSKKRLVFVTK